VSSGTGVDGGAGGGFDVVISSSSSSFLIILYIIIKIIQFYYTALSVEKTNQHPILQTDSEPLHFLSFLSLSL
jgi:hypothetical protein